MGVRKYSPEEVTIDLEYKRKGSLSKWEKTELGRWNNIWKGTEHKIFEEVKARASREPSVHR